jgi:hypothetical protein
VDGGMAEGRMELWSNGILSDFAIKFDSQMVVKRSDNADLINLIDESPYKDGYDNDWHYTLAQWVTFYLSNKKQLQTADKDEYDTSPRGYESFESKAMNPRPKPILKCHFCNLKYCLEVERKDHEEFWHSDKLSKANSKHIHSFGI